MATPALAQQNAPMGPLDLPNGVGSQFELAFWQSVASSEDPEQYQAYLQQYPKGTFSALARAKIVAIQRRSAVARGVPEQPAPAPPQLSAPVAPEAPVLPVKPTAILVAAPAAALVKAPQPAAPLAPPMATPAPVSAPAAVAQPVPAPPAVPPQPGASLMAQLQASRPSPPPGLPAGAVLPKWPTLSLVPEVKLPPRFCSALDRNAFYDSLYKPAKDTADSNNASAIAHLQKLQAMYDVFAATHEAEAMNAIAAESRSYQPTAKSAFDTSKDYEALFDRLMTVPIESCPGRPAS